MKRITALILATLTAFLMPFSAFAFTGKSIFTTSTYTHQDKFSGMPISEGVDVSIHNIHHFNSNNDPVYDIDWAKAKAAGVSFAIVRIGCRGYGNAGTLMEDKVYKQNIEKAYANGIKVGVYFYSQALNKTEAKEEANYVLKRIEAYKTKITLPVYYDYEFAGVSSGRLDSAWSNGTINKKIMTNNAKVFCNTIQSAGFDAGIYASKYFYYENLDYTQLEDNYDIWLAHYATKTDYKGKFSIWQFTSKGTVDGINGIVDSNFYYGMNADVNTFDAVIIPDQQYTGEEIVPDFSVSYKGYPLRLGVDYYLSFTNNVDYGTASVTVKGINNYEDLFKRTFKFNIVPSPVENVELTKRESTSLTVKWDKHTEADAGYRVYYYGADGRITSGDTTETSFKIVSLSGSTRYGVTVAALKSVNGKKYAGIESEKSESVTKPTKVKGIKTSSRTKNSLVLKWTKQIGATKYFIYKKNETTKAYELIGETAGKSFTACKLKPNKGYSFKIKAAVTTEKGNEVYGALSDEYVGYTAPKTPKLKYAVSKSTKKITAKWSGVSGATGYQLMWSTTSGFTKNKKSVKVKGVKKTTVEAARSTKSYYVRVRAFVTRDGKNYFSEWSNVEHLYTK